MKNRKFMGTLEEQHVREKHRPLIMDLDRCWHFVPSRVFEAALMIQLAFGMCVIFSPV